MGKVFNALKLADKAGESEGEETEQSEFNFREPQGNRDTAYPYGHVVDRSATQPGKWRLRLILATTNTEPAERSGKLEREETEGSEFNPQEPQGNRNAAESPSHEEPQGNRNAAESPSHEEPQGNRNAAESPSHEEPQGNRDTAESHGHVVDRSTTHPGQWHERLILTTTTTGPVAESIRALRTRILHPPKGKAPRSILVTSASPGEGKSFISANLAISLAQAIDNYCLLADCDLRRPSQHVLFGLSNKAGLVDFLQHKKKLPELLTPSGIEKLSILQAGPRSVNPAELMGSATMINLVDELVMRYDDRIVLLDSPPLHVASETAILAKHVEGVILVIRYGQTRREYVKALVDVIGQEKIVGVVFNAYRTNVLDSKIFGYYEYQQKYYYVEK